MALDGIVLLAVAAMSFWPSSLSAMEVPVSALPSSIMTGVARVGDGVVRRACINNNKTAHLTCWCFGSMPCIAHCPMWKVSLLDGVNV